jgi:hypothetical protein
LAAFAARTGDPRLAPILRRLTRPTRVRVVGRPGTGRATVAAALRGTGAHTLTGADAGPDDVTVLVVAETVKPEDMTTQAALVVLNKCDLLGPGAARQVAEIRRRTGRPTVPLNALLATAELDEALVAALQETAAGSAPDAVTRDRLLATLDRFGVARLTAALRAGHDAASLPELIRRLSGIDEVLTALTVVTARVRYLRAEAALAELRALAVLSGDGALWELLASDAVVLGVMAAAADVVHADGLPIGPADAVRWSRYGRGPLNALHGSCAQALTRGSLRLAVRA